MKLSTREDINAPIEAVFDQLCRFDSFERQALQRGIDVQRMDDRTTAGPGMIWRARFEIRRQPRQLVLELAQLDRHTTLRVDLTSEAFGGEFGIDLIALSRQRTRMMVFLEARPKTFTARLMVQSIRLAKSRITARFKARVADQAAEIEARCRAQ